MCDIVRTQFASNDALQLSALLGQVFAPQPFDYSSFGMTAMTSLLPLTPDVMMNMDVKPGCSEPIVGKLEIPPPPLPIRSSATCHVCAADGATLHYGGMVCGGCKIFFARAVQRKIYYVCEKSGSCRMISGKRSKCRSCRFQRCLKARMCPEEVGKLRDLKLPDRLMIQAKEENSVVPYFDLAALPSVARVHKSEQFQQLKAKVKVTQEKCEKLQSRYEFSQNAKVSPMDRFGAGEGSRYLARMLVNLERTCDNDAFASSAPDRYFCNLDVPLSEALRNPLLICERTPMTWKAMKPLEGPGEFCKPMYCRLILHYLEWLNAVDDFMAFDETCKMQLTATHVIPTILLTMSFNTFKNGSDNFLLCNGFYFAETKLYLEEYRIDVDKLVLELQRTVVQRLRELDVCEEEYVLLKLITLFTNLNASDEEIAEAMRQTRNKYVHLLAQFVKNSQKYPTEKPFDRLQALLQIIGPLTNISKIVEQHAVQLVALNLCEMRGQLAFDLHVRENF